MDADLAAFLAGREPVAVETIAWGEHLRLRVSAYLGDGEPPLPLVTSARAVVLNGESVLVQRDRDSTHILPGGRREPGEAPEETLRREVAEETGWTLTAVSRLGFLHFHHLWPMPPSYAYPYPDFLQLVFAARADTFTSDAQLADEYVLESGFLPLTDVREMPLTEKERIYLAATVNRIGGA